MNNLLIISTPLHETASGLLRTPHKARSDGSKEQDIIQDRKHKFCSGKKTYKNALIETFFFRFLTN